MVNQRVLNGDVDFLRESTALVKVPLYKENEGEGRLRTVLTDMHVDSSNLFLNQTFEDETWRKVSQDIRFRQSLEPCHQPRRIIESVYYGFAEKPLVSVGEEFSQYDVAKANALLDEMGMTGTTQMACEWLMASPSPSCWSTAPMPQTWNRLPSWFLSN